MGLLSALKAALHFPAYGGQGLQRGGLNDWVIWHGGDSFGAYDYRAAAGQYAENGVVMACLGWIMGAFPEPPVQVIRRETGSGEENAVPEHPLTLAFRTPNPYYGADCLWQRVIFDRSLHGQAFLYKERNGAGDVVALYHVPQHRLTAQWDTSGRQFVSFYLYTIEQRQERIPTEDLVHFRFAASPVNERNGLPILGAGAREIATLNEGSNYRGAILKNMGVPSHLVQAKDATRPITAEQARQLQALWAERVSGGNRGRPIIPSYPLEALKIGLSPSELDLGSMTYEAADLVCSLFGLSSMVVGISSGSEHKTYANFREAKEAATESALIPAWKQMAQDMTQHLLPDYSQDESERVEFDISRVRALAEDQSQLWDRLDNAVKTGWVTPNEARALVDLPEIEGGDDLRTPPSPGGGFGGGGFGQGDEGAGSGSAQAEPAGAAATNGNGRH